MTQPLNGSIQGYYSIQSYVHRANLFIQNKFFSPLFILFYFLKAASLLSREANIPFHNFLFCFVQLVLKQFQVYSTTSMYAPIVNQVFGLLGVTLLTNADRSVAALHTKKGKEKKNKKKQQTNKKVPYSISHGLRNHKCTRVPTRAVP